MSLLMIFSFHLHFKESTICTKRHFFWKNLAHIAAAFVDKLPQFTQKVADEIDCAKYPSPFIYPLEFPVFIGVSGGEWLMRVLFFLYGNYKNAYLWHNCALLMALLCPANSNSTA